MPKQDMTRATDLPRPSRPEQHLQSWEVPVSLPDGEFIAHILEPESTSLMQIMRQLRSGTYQKPFVLEDGEFRQLHFGLRYMQSRMRLASPDELSFAYTREMMAFLLFRPEPSHILILGMGGGSLSKFCYQQLPGTRITAVEIDRTVIELSHLFEMPEPDGRLQIIHGDGAEFVKTANAGADVILVDGCDKHGIAPAFREAAFYEDALARLKVDGVLAVNLVGSVTRVGKLKRLINEVFDGASCVLPGVAENNQILFAIRRGTWPPDANDSLDRADILRRRHGLPFIQYLRRLNIPAQDDTDRI